MSGNQEKLHNFVPFNGGIGDLEVEKEESLEKEPSELQRWILRMSTM